MVNLLLIPLLLAVLIGAVAFSFRIYLSSSKQVSWLLISATCFLWLLRSGLTLHHMHLLEPILQTMLELCCALLLFIGLGLMQSTSQASAQAAELLRKEKRNLAMLVDKRVADLEFEVAERKRAEEALKEDSERFAAIISTQQEIATSELDLNAIRQLVLIRCQALTQASGAVLEMVDGEELVYQAATGQAAPYEGIRVKRDGGLSGECVRTGCILRCHDAENDSRVNLQHCRRTGSRSIIAVPLNYRREVVGVLQVMSTERFAFTAMDVHTLQLMAGLIGAAMSQAAEFEAKKALLTEAIERAERDPLTGLLNHRAFHKQLEQSSAEAKRQGSSLAVAVMDLDNFKFFNDSYGHVTGDDVLRRVSAAIQQACRSEDIVARFGGDEFAVLAPGIDMDEAIAYAQRLKSALVDVGYQPPDYEVPIPMSLSVGVAVYPAEGETKLEVIELADSRLRRAKTGVGEENEILRLRTMLNQPVEGFSMLDALVTAVDNKDRYTHRHCEDVLMYSLEIADEIGLGPEDRDTLAIAALLHDVGKIGVPDHILRKPGRLTEVEIEAVKQHPMMGAVIVSTVPELEKTLAPIRHHHEKWDGSGYPYGLQGEMIPSLARLLAVADAFSAMTTDRPYRKGMPEEKAIKILRAGAGAQWDPKFVQAFLRAHVVKKDQNTLTSREAAVPFLMAA